MQPVEMFFLNREYFSPLIKVGDTNTFAPAIGEIVMNFAIRQLRPV